MKLLAYPTKYTVLNNIVPIYSYNRVVEYLPVQQTPYFRIKLFRKTQFPVITDLIEYTGAGSFNVLTDGPSPVIEFSVDENSLTITNNWLNPRLFQSYVPLTEVLLDLQAESKLSYADIDCQFSSLSISLPGALANTLTWS